MSSALSPKTWPFSLEWLPHSACLVGGTVRDAILGRHSDYLDLDFVMPIGAVETAQAIARHYKAGYVLLDAERQIARVVFEQGTADFAQQVGPSLEADLARRDFTVNAIAYNPHTDQLLDPLQGYADLQKRLLRMVSAENLQEDPLRLLRAYRQAAQLGFTVEAETRTVVRQLSTLLRHIAAERIQSELNYLLGTSKGTSWLTMAWQDGLLQAWLPDATALSLVQVAAIDQTIAILQERFPAFAGELFNRIRSLAKQAAVAVDPVQQLNALLPGTPESKGLGSARTWLTTTKLACLLPSNCSEAESQLRRLKYSRSEIQAVTTILKFLPQLCPATNELSNQPNLIDQPNFESRSMTYDCRSSSTVPAVESLRSQYEFFQGVGAAFPAVALLAIALGTSLTTIAPLIHRFLTPDDPVAHPTPMLTGQDLMTALHLSAGPQIGHLLAAIQLARAEGKIATRADALQLAAGLVNCSKQGS